MPLKQAFPRPKPQTSVRMAPASPYGNPATNRDAGLNLRRKQVVNRSAAMASQGMSIGPGTSLERIKNVALKTFGWNSVLWLRQQIELDRTVLEMDRSTFIETWWELSKYFSPRRPRFLESDVNKGWRRNGQIIDDTGGMAKDVLAAGMLAGVSSPNRLWFGLGVGDMTLDENQTVKDWCYKVTQLMAAVFYKSNLYEELPQMYEDAAVFATGLVWMEESNREVVSFKSLPIGSYSIHHDNQGHLNKFYRSFMMTAQQLLDEFGHRNAKGEIDNWENFSQAVRTAHDNHTLDYWFYVGHYIRPNHEFEPEAAGTFGMPWLECYFERGQVNQAAPGVSTTSSGSEQWRFLRIRGLQQMPVMELIWKKTGEDDYGTECPGIRAIGDVKQLQAQERRVSQASEKMINPPMQGPATLKGQRVSILAGDLTTYDQRSGDPGFRPAHEVNLNIQMMEQRSDRIRGRIKQFFYYDLFLMMEQEQESSQPITAEEVREKHEEKLLMLSPVLEKANRGAFNPLIQFTYRCMLQRGMIPPMPSVMKGKELQVEYTSIFAQSLKMIELEALDKFSQWLQEKAQIFPEMLDVVDADDMVRQYADLVTLPPTIIRTEDAIKVIRQQRAQQQQQQQQAAQAQQQAETAAKLSSASTDPSQPTALTQMMQDAQAGSLNQQ